jgi:hypothetical protein
VRALLHPAIVVSRYGDAQWAIPKPHHMLAPAGRLQAPVSANTSNCPYPGRGIATVGPFPDPPRHPRIAARARRQSLGPCIIPACPRKMNGGETLYAESKPAGSFFPHGDAAVGEQVGQIRAEKEIEDQECVMAMLIDSANITVRRNPNGRNTKNRSWPERDEVVAGGSCYWR